MEARTGARRGLGAAALLYLALAVALWWHAWTGGASSTLASGSLDPAQNVWWLAWVPHALGQGANPFFTRAMFWPDGANVVANTSFLLVGLVLSPVTVLFGPVASFTVAVTLAPAADGLAAFVALRRFVSWAPAAFAGGLLYGFGPFVATDLRYGHLNLTLLVFPPLLLVLLDRIVRGGRRMPPVLGVLLGLLLAAEFFVSTEMLALGVVTGAIGLVVFAIASWRRLAARCSAAIVALAGGVALAVTLLAYPVWWYLRGPRHFSGAVWRDMARFSATLGSFVLPHGQLEGVGFLSGGNGDYLGIGLLVVVAAGALWWRGDSVLRFAVGMGFVTALLSLGPSLHAGTRDTGVPLPAWPILHLPLLDSVAPSRFGAFTDLFAALALGRVLENLRQVLARRRVRPSDGRSSLFRRATPAIGAMAVTAGALVPVAVVQPWPYPVAHLQEPSVLDALGSLPDGAVVREYPLVSGTDGRALVWQARAGLRYAMTDGYAIVPGTDGRAGIRPPTDTLGIVFAGLALGRISPPFATSLVAAVHRHAWDHQVVAVVVVRASRRGPELASLLGAALGPPTFEDHSGWLWRRPSAVGPASLINR